MGTSLVVRTQAKDLCKFDGKELNVSGDFYERLNKKVEAMIKDACVRAKENNRNTVMGRDL